MSDWQRPSNCSDAACIQVMIDEQWVVLRDEVGHEVHYTRDEWADFVAAVKAGEFDG